MIEMTFTQALREAMSEEMERDPSVFLLGEDIGLYGGAFGVTRGLLDRFGPERVRQTPISESSFVGIGVGAAMGGMRPIIELMFGDFVTCCMDALVNHAAKIHYMYDEQLNVPLVLRMPIGRRHGYGATHSQSLESWFLHVPGLITVAPATPSDAKGLLKTVIRDPNPVIFLEHKLLYPMQGPVSEGEVLVPLGEARLVRRGEDATVISYASSVRLAEEAAEILEGEGISLEVIDLRTLSPLDTETCTASVQKTGRLIVIAESWRRGGATETIACEILDRVFSYLRAPIVRIGAHEVPIPSSAMLEDHVMPRADQLVEEARRLVRDY